MAIKLKIKKGDTVKIIAGDDKGKTGEVLAVLPKERKVIVKDCKLLKKLLSLIKKKILRVDSLTKKCQLTFQM